MAIFDINEVFQFAIRIEQNGEKFYRHAAGISDDEAAGYLFNFLADEEVKHGRIFKDMLANMDLLSKMETQPPPESYPGEYMQYLRNYLDNAVVFNERAEEEFSGIRDMLSAINFAIDRETDSILYYSEIKPLFPKSGHPFVDEIIAEERKHFLKLSEFKKEYETKS